MTTCTPTRGNRTKRTHTTSGDHTEYSWDHRNRLTQIAEKDSTHAVLESIDYEYDVFDRRIQKTVTPAVGPAEVEQYVYAGDSIVLQ